MSWPAVFGVLLCILSAGNATAHEHHSDNIPEGEAVSAEPIVAPPFL